MRGGNLLSRPGVGWVYAFVCGWGSIWNGVYIDYM